MKNLIRLLLLSLVLISLPVAAFSADEKPVAKKLSNLFVPWINKDQFETVIATSKHPVLIEFGATWCPYCRHLLPMLEEMAVQKSGSLVIYRIDVDLEGPLSDEYEVKTLPTLILFDHGKVLGRFDGAPKKEDLYDWVNDMIGETKTDEKKPSENMSL